MTLQGEREERVINLKLVSNRYKSFARSKVVVVLLLLGERRSRHEE